jgi:hypothetical protein
VLQTGAKGVFNPGLQKGRGFWRSWASTNASFCNSDYENNKIDRKEKHKIEEPATYVHVTINKFK